ncbi:double homeobox protein B [Molossus nigricans]
MDLNSTASGSLQKETCQVRIAYNQSQKAILQKQFDRNPYPDTATKKQLAKKTGIPEYNIQIWFKNQRAKQRSEWSLERDPTQEPHQHQPWAQEYLPKEARQDQTSITSSQSNIPVQPFDRDHFPDTATRKILAKQTGIQESRIQNRSSPYPGQSRSKLVNSMVNNPHGTPDLAVQQHQISLSALPDGSHLPSSNFFNKNQTSLPAPFPSHVSFVPRVSQGPSVLMVQPIQAVQEGENSLSTQTLTNYLPVLLTPGGDRPNTHTPFWPQNQEKCQNHEEQTATEVLQLKDYNQPHTEHEKHQSQDLDQTDLPYIMQRWDECCQALIAEWDPQKGTH